MKPHKDPRKAAILLLILAVSTVCLLYRININPVSANSSGAVYYTSDANFVYVYHPNLNVTIRFTRANFRDGGTITSIQYEGSANIVNSDPQFGFISLYNLNGSSLNEYIGGTTLISATGNNTGQLTLTFQATVVNDGLNGTVISGITSTIKYTFYADIDAIFDTVTFTSTQNIWLYAHAEYGASLNMITFTSYNATGFQYHNSTSGNLVQGGATPVNTSPLYNILTVMNATANLAMTVFPTSVRPSLGTIKDGTTGTKLTLYGKQVSTYDTRNGNSVVWGSYWGNGISYSICWALSTGGNPFIVVPWTMPNSVPFGLYQTYDDLPSSTGDYNSYPPNANATNMNAWLSWVYGAAGRRVTLNLLYDALTGAGTPNSTGADGSWLVHGRTRLANMTSDHKAWMASMEGQQIDFQTHAYHHDYPWKWEFSLVQNVTWINATFNQMWLDAQTLGMGNDTFKFFKPAGFNFEPQGLNITTAYGIQMLDRNFDPTMVPLSSFYMDESNRLLVLSTDVCDISDGINANIAYPQLVNELVGNITTLNFVSVHGHFPSTSGSWSTFNNVFAAAESLYGNGLDYFLPAEITAYWNILATLTYTFNTTGLFASSPDSRLSYELLNRPASFSLNGMLSYSGTVPSAHEIYSPNFDTNGWTFNRATGFASVTSISNTTRQGLQFSVSQPQNTTGYFNVYMPLGNPQIISGVKSSSYNAATHFLTLVTNGSSSITATYATARAREIIYIRADGSIDPTTAPISTIDKVTYTFTGNIDDSIVVERDNIVVDGSGHIVQGTLTDSSRGIDLTGRSNETIKNTNIKAFYFGIYLDSSSSSSVSGNNITNNSIFGIALVSSSNNRISENNITANKGYGIYLYGSSDNNTICRNNITNNWFGIALDSSSNNSVYPNNFVNNTQQVYSSNSTNIWNDGYPSGGNYWSDYGEKYPNATELDGSGVWNTPYVIDENNTDKYPLVHLYVQVLGDINDDRTVDIYDAILLASAFNSMPETPNWNPNADFNGDSLIDIFDAIILAGNFGKTS